jgi:hypothetical protein
MLILPQARVRSIDSRLISALLVSVAIGGLSAAASAEDFKVGDATIEVHGGATLGTAIRTTNRDPKLLAENGAAVGVPGTALGGRNQDDGNLNYKKGDQVSTVGKAFMSVDAKLGSFGVFARGMGWYDYAMARNGVPWGNIPNGYAPGQPLSDAGFDNAAKFSSVSLQELYFHGQFNVGSVPVLAKVGNQRILWGSPTTTPGGIFTTINGIDRNARSRPGALPEDAIVPTPAGYSKIDLSKQFSIEGFYQYAHSQSEEAGCGTFFATTDYRPAGCDKVFIGGGTDQNALANGFYVKRAATPKNTDVQFGLGGTYVVESIGTKFGLFFAQVDSRGLSNAIVVTTSKIAPYIPGDPFGTNGQYREDYVPNTQIYSSTFNTRLQQTTLSGEVAIRHNAPVSLNALDLLNAFASNSAPTTLRADQMAATPGSIYAGYDRFNLGYYDLRVSQGLPGILGGAKLVVGGEVAGKQVFNLPDVNVRRYGRSDFAGGGPVNGVCQPGTAGTIGCSNDGYVTAFAWNYSLNAAVVYENAFTTGLTITPSIGVSHDVKGWAYDSSFMQGRVVANLALKAEYKQFFANVRWNPALAISPYDAFSDRQIVSVSAGMKF